MKDNHSIAKMRQCFNQSIFSTQVSSRSHLQHQQSQASNNFTRISSKFIDQPQKYLKKIKNKSKEASSKCLQALKDIVKVKSHLQKIEKEASVSRYEFNKLYTIKKFKIEQQSLLSSHCADHQQNVRISQNRIKNDRMLNELSISNRKQQTMRNIQRSFQLVKREKQLLRDSLRFSEWKHSKMVEQSVERIKKERMGFQIRKKNLTQLNSTKSKFNYLTKINEEMQAIKDCQQAIQFINRDDPELEYTGRYKFANTFTARFY